MCETTKNNEIVYEATNCFAVPFMEKGGDVAVGKDFQKQMGNLHRQISKNEKVIGWYSTSFDEANSSVDEDNNGQTVVSASSLIHDFYSQICQNSPIHLIVDCSFNIQPKLLIKSYIASSVTVSGVQLATMFNEIKCEMVADKQEQVACDYMIKKGGENNNFEKEENCGDNKEVLTSSLTKLQEMIKSCEEYTTDIIDGKKVPNTKLFNMLQQAISSSTNNRSDNSMNKMFNAEIQDLLSVMYLGKIAKVNLAVSEKVVGSLTV